MLSFEGIKCKQYKKNRQDKKSRNSQAFVQGRLFFLSPFPPPQKRILKSTVFCICILSCTIGLHATKQEGLENSIYQSAERIPLPFQAQGTHTVVTHKGLSCTIVRVPKNPLEEEEALICSCSFVNAFLPSFQKGLQRSTTVFESYWLTLAVRKTLKCSLKDNTG